MNGNVIQRVSTDVKLTDVFHCAPSTTVEHIIRRVQNWKYLPAITPIPTMSSTQYEVQKDPEWARSEANWITYYFCYLALV